MSNSLDTSKMGSMKQVDGGESGACSPSRRRRQVQIWLDPALRLLTVAFCIVAFSTMVTSDESGTATFYSIPFTISIGYNSIRAFRYLVITLAIVAAYSFLHFILGTIQACRKGCWGANFLSLCYVLDQVSAYLVVSAAAAAGGASTVNGLGVADGVTLPNVCESLGSFCKHVKISIAFAILASLTSASCAALHVYASSLP